MLQYPLVNVTSEQLQSFCKLLWSWPTCACTSGTCSSTSCTSLRTKRLLPFFKHYKNITSAYEVHTTPYRLVLQDYTDVARLVELLRSHATLPRHELVIRALPSSTERPHPPPLDDAEQAIELVVNAMFMISCTTYFAADNALELGSVDVGWGPKASLEQFIMEAFPETDHPGIRDDKDQARASVKRSLMARKLKKNADLMFVPTNDLRRHLRLDRKKGEVEVFHHAGYIKEQLRLSKGTIKGTSVGDCLKRGALPRQLMLETLDSVQKILFPLHDKKSVKLLRSLVSKSDFDPECLRWDFTLIRDADEGDPPYHYWGARLADLYAELESPTPRTWLEKWLERWSGARYVMMATLIGVLFALLLGVASLALSSYQAWIGYQAWKHPVNPSSGHS